MPSFHHSKTVYRRRARLDDIIRSQHCRAAHLSCSAAATEPRRRLALRFVQDTSRRRLVPESGLFLDATVILSGCRYTTCSVSLLRRMDIRCLLENHSSVWWRGSSAVLSTKRCLRWQTFFPNNWTPRLCRHTSWVHLSQVFLLLVHDSDYLMDRNLAVIWSLSAMTNKLSRLSQRAKTIVLLVYVNISCKGSPWENLSEMLSKYSAVGVSYECEIQLFRCLWSIPDNLLVCTFKQQSGTSPKLVSKARSVLVTSASCERVFQLMTWRWQPALLAHFDNC